MRRCGVRAWINATLRFGVTTRIRARMSRMRSISRGELGLNLLCMCVCYVRVLRVSPPVNLTHSQKNATTLHMELEKLAALLQARTRLERERGVAALRQHLAAAVDKVCALSCSCSQQPTTLLISTSRSQASAQLELQPLVAGLLAHSGREWEARHGGLLAAAPLIESGMDRWKRSKSTLSPTSSLTHSFLQPQGFCTGDFAELVAQHALVCLRDRELRVRVDAGVALGVLCGACGPAPVMAKIEAALLELVDECAESDTHGPIEGGDGSDGEEEVAEWCSSTRSDGTSSPTSASALSSSPTAIEATQWKLFETAIRFRSSMRCC